MYSCNKYAVIIIKTKILKVFSIKKAKKLSVKDLKGFLIKNPKGFLIEDQNSSRYRIFE